LFVDGKRLVQRRLESEWRSFEARLAAAAGVELAALDLGLFNWERGRRASVGLGPEAASDPEVLEAAYGALEL